MPYPSKINRAGILKVAVEQLERDGPQALSLRSLAASLEVAPNALYRYFADRSALEAAISAESARRLLSALTRAGNRSRPPAAIAKMADAYLRFARGQPHLYEALMADCPPAPGDAEAHEQLWSAVLVRVGALTGVERAPEASVALWALLHGFAALERAEVFGEQKPATALGFALDAWSAAAMGAVPARRSPIVPRARPHHRQSPPQRRK